jgi:zinc transport system permease protein
MFEEFLLRAFAGGLGVVLTAAPLGCFVVWRRMAYFGDSLAHSALLGVAGGALVGIDIRVGVIAVGVAIALILAGLESRTRLATDTLLGIAAHGTLALGFIAVTVTPGLRADVAGLLFGDILALSWADVGWIWAGALFVIAILAALRRPLLLMTLDADLAAAEGVATARLRIALMLLMVLAVALAMKAVGALLITALLLIPAATARHFAHSPEGMAAGATVIGAFSVAGGLAASFGIDLPAGPAIVTVALILFALTQLAPQAGRA